MFDLGNIAVVRLLIEHGADIYSVNEKGKIPLELSIEHGKLVGFPVLKRNLVFLENLLMMNLNVHCNQIMFIK